MQPARLSRYARSAFAFVAASVLFTLSATAQTPATGSVTGRVLNSTDGKYIDSARVTVEGTKIEAVTDLSGTYHLEGVPAGEAKVDVVYGGLAPQTQTVTVAAGQEATQDFSLAGIGAAAGAAGSDVMKLDTFVVASEKEFNAQAIATNEQRFAPNIKNVVAADAFGHITEGNLGEFLKFLPGVTIEYNSMDARWIMLRGIPSTYTAVTVDGMRMASAASTSPGRFFEFEQVSINNVARVETIKSRTPDISADSTGGSVNLISLSAFEYSKPEFDYNVSMVANSAYEELGKTPGVQDNTQTNKILPSVDFKMIDPVSKTFGFTISYLSSNMYNPQYRSNPGWFPYGTNSAVTSATSQYLANPFLEKYTMQDAPKISIRNSLAGTMDWKISSTDTISFSTQENVYNSLVHARNINFDASTTAPVSYGPTFTNGALGKGSVFMSSSDRKKFGTTFNLNSRYTHDGPVWTITADLGYSHASAHYADEANGYPDVISLTMSNVTVNYAGIDQYQGVRPATIGLFNAAGTTAIDYTNYNNYTIKSITSDPSNATDVMKTANVAIKRDFDWILPTTIKIGGDIRVENRDIHSIKDSWNFVGPDGKAGTADDLASLYPIADTVYSRVAPPYGFSNFQWASNVALYNLQQSNPAYFQLVQTGTGGSIAFEAEQSPYFKETIPAAYIMGDSKGLDNRLRLVYGVRFEATQDQSWGPLFDPTLGNGITDPVAQTQAEYKFRGSYAEVNYSGIYPSFNASYNIKDNLIARLAYYRSLGRPTLSNILPGYASTVNTTAETISVPNPALKPEQANSYDATLEYYFDRGGLFTVGAYRKDFTNFFGSVTEGATPAILEFLLGLPQDYLGYAVTTPLNSGTAHVTGVEVNFQQKLTMLPGMLSGLSVFANGASEHLQGGPFADFTSFISKSANYGVSFDQPKYSASVKWNYRGKELESGVLAFDPSGREFFKALTVVEIELDYRLTHNFGFFFSGRNITNVTQDLTFEDPATPAYAKLDRREDFGAIWTLGVKGQF